MARRAVKTVFELEMKVRYRNNIEKDKVGAQKNQHLLGTVWIKALYRASSGYNVKPKNAPVKALLFPQLYVIYFPFVMNFI